MKNFRQSPGSVAVKALLLCASFVAASAYAVVTAPTALTISAEVVASCLISSATPVTLTGQTFGTAGTGAGSVEVQCTGGTPYDVLLDQGAGQGATTAARVLTGVTTPGNTMTYGLYQDAANLIPWGDTVGADTLHEIGNGTAQSWPVNMKILTGLDVAPSQSYTDAVNVTVSY